MRPVLRIVPGTEQVFNKKKVAKLFTSYLITTTTIIIYTFNISKNIRKTADTGKKPVSAASLIVWLWLNHSFHPAERQFPSPQNGEGEIHLFSPPKLIARLR